MWTQVAKMLQCRAVRFGRGWLSAESSWRTCICVRHSAHSTPSLLLRGWVQKEHCQSAITMILINTHFQYIFSYNRACWHDETFSMFNWAIYSFTVVIFNVAVTIIQRNNEKHIISNGSIFTDSLLPVSPWVHWWLYFIVTFNLIFMWHCLWK